jgi:hypothetical protein
LENKTIKSKKYIYLYAFVTVITLAVITASGVSEISISNAKLIESTLPRSTELRQTMRELNDNKTAIANLINGGAGIVVNEDGSVSVNDADDAALAIDARQMAFSEADIYKVHGVNSADIASDYAKTGDFGMWITEDVSLYAPVRDAKGNIISTVVLRKIRGVEELDLNNIQDSALKNEMIDYAQKYEGQYKIVLVGNAMPSEVSGTFSIPSKMAGILRKHNLKNIDEIKLVTLFQYGTNIIYVGAGEKEYAIPLDAGKDAKLASEALYSMDGMVGILQAVER